MTTYTSTAPVQGAYQSAIHSQTLPAMSNRPNGELPAANKPTAHVSTRTVLPPLQHNCEPGGCSPRDRHVRRSPEPQNFALLRRIALVLMKRETSVRSGAPTKQFRAAVDPTYAMRVLPAGIPRNHRPGDELALHRGLVQINESRGERAPCRMVLAARAHQIDAWMISMTVHVYGAMRDRCAAIVNSVSLVERLAVWGATRRARGGESSLPRQHWAIDQQQEHQRNHSVATAA